MFCLGKGTGFMVQNYIASKFMQIAGIHAAAYPSGEFRHGPLSMIDEAEKTPGKWLLFGDPFERKASLNK